MDITAETRGFAEVVNSFNDLVKPLRNIQSFKGSDYFVNELVRRIQSFLVSKNLFNEDGSCPERSEISESLREIFLLLVSSTDAKYFYSVSWGAAIVSLIEMKLIPELSMCLIYMLIWKLDLRELLLEFMSFAPLELVGDMLVIFPEAMKYLDEENDLNFAEKFIVAIYTNVSGAGSTNCDTSLDFCTVFLNDYFNGDAEAHPALRNRKFCILLGHMIRHMLKAILSCMKIFINPQEKKQDCPEIYKKFFEGMEEEENDNKEENSSLLQFNEKLFSKLQNLIDRVTVLVYCEWVEIDMEPNMTLQQTIRDLAEQFIKIPNETNGLQHEVFEHIKFLTVQPKNDQPVASEATLGDVLNQLETSKGFENKSLWLSELISRGELVLENEECLEAINTNLIFLKLDNYVELARFLQNSNPETEETIRDIILQGLAVLPVEDAVQLMNTELIYLPVDTMQTKSFDIDAEMFFTSKKWTESGYLRLLAQNPPSVIEKMSQWVIEHEKDMKVALKFLQMTQKITGIYLEDNIKALIAFPTGGVTSSRLLANWICRLFNCGLIKKSKVVRDLSKNLVEFVTKRDERRILGIVTIFSGLAQKSSFGEESVKVLTIAARVLDKSRWNLETYTEEIKEIVRLAIVTIVETMKDFLKYSSQAEKAVLKEKIASCSPSTGFYFQKLSLDKVAAPLNFAEFLFEKNSLDDVSQEDLEEFLLEKIIHITPKETVWMASNKFLRPHFAGVLRQIATRVTDLPLALRVSPAKCFRNCMANYQQALEKLIIPELVNDRDKVIFLHRMLELFDVIPQEIFEEIGQNLLPQLVPLFEEVLREEECIPDCHLVLKDQVMCLRDGKFRRNLMRMFPI
ncbi:uncharacterized protein LOC129790158 [Lutzomyia longipalpis]|uniref:uncharacterized protein LOC129790158 n=1 Tax=Lutzomyia longipalpis TaxID=7200 RepID=UPI002483A44E|nr:uncharacterized protein LOC129790158 [Lutzomyia longipalpis]